VELCIWIWGGYLQHGQRLKGSKEMCFPSFPLSKLSGVSIRYTICLARLSIPASNKPTLSIVCVVHIVARPTESLSYLPTIEIWSQRLGACWMCADILDRYLY
jgi:hypothetical protein